MSHSWMSSRMRIIMTLYYLIYIQSLLAFGQNKKAGMTERPALPAPPSSVGWLQSFSALRVGEFP